MKLNKRDLIFLTIGVLMLFIVLGYLGLAIGFLGRKVNSVLDKGSALSQPPLGFEIDKAEILYRKISGK